MHTYGGEGKRIPQTLDFNSDGQKKLLWDFSFYANKPDYEVLQRIRSRFVSLGTSKQIVKRLRGKYWGRLPCCSHFDPHVCINFGKIHQLEPSQIVESSQSCQTQFAITSFQGISYWIFLCLLKGHVYRYYIYTKLFVLSVPSIVLPIDVYCIAPGTFRAILCGLGFHFFPILSV